MAFDKKYPKRKDWRKPYPSKSSKSFDYSCRNNGGCPACEGNRHYSERKRMESAECSIKEFFHQ